MTEGRFRKDLAGLATRTAAVLALAFLLVPSVSAQTTIALRPDDTTLRGGSYADKNFGTAHLVTRASGDATYVRRILLKFDTHNTIPAGAPIASATLTLTVRGGNSESRTLSAYAEPYPFNEAEATWIRRKTSHKWNTPGGDTAGLYGTAAVTHTAGSKVTFDVRALVQDVVNGKFGSRYSRLLVFDEGGSSRGSYKEYHSAEATNTAVRPTLSVTYGGTTANAPTTQEPTTAPSSSGSNGSVLRVLHWNLHHGVGTDGKYDLNRIATWMATFDPHIISLNEVERYTYWGNEDQPARYEALMEQKTGKSWHRLFIHERGKWSSNGQGHLILSRIPFDSTSRHNIAHNRTVGRAAVTFNGRTINLFTTHWDYQRDHTSQRVDQAKDTVALATNFAQQRIIAGDLNATPSEPAVAVMNLTYFDAWALGKQMGVAVSYPGNEAGNTRNSRIDYVYFSKSAGALVLTKVQVPDTRDSKGHMPSDHRPILASFEVK